MSWRDSTYQYHLFTSSGTFTSSQYGSAEVAVIAGGGGGGAGRWGGGGGGGGCVIGTGIFNAGSNTITVGTGGQGMPYWDLSTGWQSVASTLKAGQGGHSSAGGLTATGGGGSQHWWTSMNGGSGAGEGPHRGAGSAGTGISGQGHNGGEAHIAPATHETHFVSGGGGGCGGAGQNAGPSTPGNGGSGLNILNFPSPLFGVGWTDLPSPWAVGPWFGSGGGGSRGWGNSWSAACSTSGDPTNPYKGAGQCYQGDGRQDAPRFSGGGGGGGLFHGAANYAGGAGGSGVVIIRRRM